MPNWTKEQTLAINEKGKNIIVSAGAGSGKTAVLTERVITHLKEGVGIDNLLILTFTNAAATEMKIRIRNKIKKYPKLKQELNKIDNAYITSFDAYALSLVKKYSHIIGVSSNIQIADGTFIALKKEKVLKEIFEKHYKEKTPLFIKMLDDLTVKDDKEIFESIISLDSKLQNIFDKRQFLKNYIDTYYKKEKLSIYISEYLKMIEEKKKEVKNKIKALSMHLDGEYIQKINEAIAPMISSKTYKDIKESVTSKIPRAPKGIEDEAKKLKKSITQTLKKIEELTKYDNETQIIETIQKTKDYAKIIIQILLELDEEMTKFKKKYNIYEFIDISNMAIKLLKENEEVRLQLKENFYEILIDEYQDTNDLQELFVCLIEKDNVYMVGDIKQSIYRFRNTNPKLFKNKYSLYSKGEKGYKIDLNKNFRSRKEVLESINELFNYIMTEDIGGAEYKVSHQMIYGNKTYEEVNKENYKLEILDYKDNENFTKEEIEIFTVAKDIKDKIESGYELMDREVGKGRKATYSDFAILMDRSSSFEKYKQIFEYLNIPLSVYKDKAITDSTDILIIKNIYTLIIEIHHKRLSKKFKYSFMSISRSYLMEIDDATIFNTLKNPKETEVYKICYEISKNILEKTNYDLIDEIIDKFDIYQKIIKDGNIQNHIVILDSIKKIAKNLDDIGYTPFEFLDYLNEVLEKDLDIKLKLNKGNNDSVKIMTIHTSKGLEYPICYYTGLFKKFNIDDLKQKIYFDQKYGIITPYIDNGPKTTILKKLLRRDYLKEEISEKLRLFYVALTRAREKMIIVTDLNQKPFNEANVVDDMIRLKYLSFKDIIDSLDYVIDKYIKEVDLEKINLTKKYNLSKKKNITSKFKNGQKITVNPVNIKSETIEKNNFSKKINKLMTKEEVKNIELGLKMHEIFENIDFKKTNFNNLSEFEKKKVESFIKTGILEGSKEIFKEYEFIYEKENKTYQGIIDLLIIKENENIIVDYKLRNTDDKAYINQLNGYKNYIENLTSKTTKTYLYSILNEKLTEIRK